MSETEKILQELKSLHEKLDAIGRTVDSLVAKKKEAAAKKASAGLPQLKPEEVAAYKNRFDNLYQRWLANDEAAVREELQAMAVEELRKFADANNLNVTAKTPKEKLVQQVGYRFREKKQLTHNVIRPTQM